MGRDIVIHKQQSLNSSKQADKMKMATSGGKTDLNIIGRRNEPTQNRPRAGRERPVPSFTLTDISKVSRLLPFIITEMLSSAALRQNKPFRSANRNVFQSKYHRFRTQDVWPDGKLPSFKQQYRKHAERSDGQHIVTKIYAGFT